jgi:Ala-tRNA(Pro) deacylase
MASTRALLEAFLDRHGIAWRVAEHPPVCTVEEAETHTGHLPGGHCKNLFLKDRKGDLWLVVALARRPVDVNRLARALGAPRFSFGRPELLAEVLGVEPGAVTPFALINDGLRRVQPVLDQGMLELAELNYHPLTNAATTTIAATDLLRFLEILGYRPIILDLGTLAQAPG